MANAANTVTLITSEVLANSIGGTLVSNTLQLTNATGNGSTLEIQIAGQSLPQYFGSSVNYSGVIVNIYAGANGNTQDQLLVSVPVTPLPLQQGCFSVTGLFVVRGNAKSGGSVSNSVWTGFVTAPGVAQGGIPTLNTIYVGATSNGAVNAILSSTNTANVTIWVQPQDPFTNCNASITSIVAYTSNGAGSPIF